MGIVIYNYVIFEHALWTHIVTLEIENIHLGSIKHYCKYKELIKLTLVNELLKYFTEIFLSFYH
jgi:hypothetical protein